MATPQWTAEITVTAALARTLIAAQFPALAALPVTPYGNGWDNTAFLAGDDLIFRFPRRGFAAPLIAREIAVLPLLAPHLSAAISAPGYAGAPSEAYPWPFAGYPRIAGATLCSTAMRAPQLAAELGAFLRALHALPLDGLRAAGLRGDEIARLAHAKRFPLAAERLRGLHAQGRIADPAALIGELARIAPRPGEAEPRVVHGDLYARHIVVDERGALAGVIDWGDVHAGDPALDLAAAQMLFDADDRAAFERAYGAIDARTRERARYRAIYHSAMTAEYAAAIDDAALLHASLAALTRLSP